jgi:hypothetical protein
MAKSEPKKEKPLVLWNGSFINQGTQYTVYAAAYSRSDLIKMVESYLGFMPRGLLGFIRQYWHRGQWGRQMDHVTPIRGLWTTPYASREKPTQVFPAP